MSKPHDPRPTCMASGSRGNGNGDQHVGNRWLQRGGWLAERLVWVAIGIVLVADAHLLPALAARLDALDAEAGEVRRYQLIEDSNATSCDCP